MYYSYLDELGAPFTPSKNNSNSSIANLGLNFLKQKGIYSPRSPSGGERENFTQSTPSLGAGNDDHFRAIRHVMYCDKCKAVIFPSNNTHLVEFLLIIILIVVIMGQQ